MRALPIPVAGSQASAAQSKLQDVAIVRRPRPGDAKFLLGPSSSGVSLTRQAARDAFQMRLRARRSMFLEELQEEKRADARGGETTIVDKITFNTPLKIVRYPDPKLRAPNAQVSLPAEGLKELADKMFEVMYMDDGIGLAAPQVGVNIRMMVFNPEGIDARGDKSLEKVLVNPRIVRHSKNTEIDVEGCLSFPGMLGDVERSTGVKIKARGLDGEKIDLKLNGLVARIFQHEFDHLQGVLFFERMSSDVVDTVRPQLVEWEEEFLKSCPDVPIQRVK